jgi:hypothetical protein
MARQPRWLIKSLEVEMNLKQMQQNFANHLRHGHVWSSTVSRRHFIRTAAGAGAAGLMVSSGLFSKAFAVPSSSDPKPIPGGEQLLFPDPTVFHLHLPGFPPFPDNNPATKDPSVITDFNGDVGLAYVNGTGTHTDLVTGDETHLTFGVDLRFMKGEYVGEDGNHHHGAFALI